MDEYGRLESTPLEEVRNWDYDDIYFSLRPYLDTSEGAFIPASRSEDSSRLEFLLERAQLLDEEDRLEVLDQIPPPDMWGGMDLPTPLLEAIRTKRQHNVRLLLHAGANPDGVPYDIQIQLSRLHRRFTTRPNEHPDNCRRSL